MAKDRFSRFKRSNWDNNFRWGNDYNKPIKPKFPKRQSLNKVQKKWLADIYNRLQKQSSRNFIQSILEIDKVPTEKQKEVIRKIIKNG